MLPARRWGHYGGQEGMLSKLTSRIIVFGAVLALLAAGAVLMSSRLPKQAAALESIDPAIISTHLQKLQPDLALP